jgi:hypothetical protein
VVDERTVWPEARMVDEMKANESKIGGAWVASASGAAT